MALEIPTAGRIVHFHVERNRTVKDDKGRETTETYLKPLPALVVGAHDDGACDLHVFHEQGNDAHQRVPGALEPTLRAWSWPPRADRPRPALVRVELDPAA